MKRIGTGHHRDPPVKRSQRELVLASLQRGVGKDSCAGAKHGAGGGTRPAG